MSRRKSSTLVRISFQGFLRKLIRSINFLAEKHAITAMTLQLFTYKKSLLLKGVDQTDMILMKAIADMGAKWNSSLGGYIFPKKLEMNLCSSLGELGRIFTHTGEYTYVPKSQTDVSSDGILRLYDHTGLLLLTGSKRDDHVLHVQLRGNNGKWNPELGGWQFVRESEPLLTECIRLIGRQLERCGTYNGSDLISL